MKSLHRWKDIVPEGFVFAAKANRCITHYFDNDQAAYAAQDAKRLSAILQR